MRNFCSNICFIGILSEHNLCGHWCSPPGQCPPWFPPVTYFDTLDFQTAKDANARDKLVDLFIRFEQFFRRLEAYTGITPTVAMTERIVDIVVGVLSVLAIATKEAKFGRESMSLIFAILN